jgi:hypothetical protein
LTLPLLDEVPVEPSVRRYRGAIVGLLVSVLVIGVFVVGARTVFGNTVSLTGGAAATGPSSASEPMAVMIDEFANNSPFDVSISPRGLPEGVRFGVSGVECCELTSDDVTWVTGSVVVPAGDKVGIWYSVTADGDVPIGFYGETFTVTGPLLLSATVTSSNSGVVGFPAGVPAEAIAFNDEDFGPNYGDYLTALVTEIADGNYSELAALMGPGVSVDDAEAWAATRQDADLDAGQTVTVRDDRRIIALDASSGESLAPFDIEWADFRWTVVL